MSIPYNRFVGQSLNSLTALSDGVFAVAMTLLVLDVRIPTGVKHTNRHLWDALTKLGPNLGAYLLSFTMLGTFWLAQHAFLGLCTRTNRTLTWLNMAFLLVVTLLPFSASVLAEYPNVALAVGVYGFNILLLGLALAASSSYVARSKLVDDLDVVKLKIFRRRTLVAQAAYGLAALICLANAYASIAALGAVQLYFIVSPHIASLDRLLQPSESDR